MLKDGLTETEIAEKLAPTTEMMEKYQSNRPFRMGLTFLEIFPVGLIISLISAGLFAFVLKKE